MMTAKRTTGLMDRLPPVRGELTADAPIARFTWFKVGGPAEVLFEPADAGASPKSASTATKSPPAPPPMT